MANVAVYNIEGKEVGTIDLNDAVFSVSERTSRAYGSCTAALQINVRELRKRRHVLKYPEAEENRGDRKEQVTQDRDLQELRSGQVVEWYLLLTPRLLFQIK